MQNKPKPKGQAHDNDLLLASNVSSFKQWLITQGIPVRHPETAHKERGVHYWVDVPGCKPVSVQEGTGRQSRFAQTHFRLRQLLNSYLTSPVASAVREVVRTKAPGPLLAVVGNKLQQPAVQDNSRALAILPPSGKYLISADDINRALELPSAIPADATYNHVFGVRVAGEGEHGLTVAAHMHVHEVVSALGTSHLVDVVGYPVYSPLTDLKSLAQQLFLKACQLPNATILVDVRGLGAQFLAELQALSCPTVKRYGMMMGQPLPKRGAGARFANRRAECTVQATTAIKKGALKLAYPLPIGPGDSTMDRLGARIPYSFDDQGRYNVPKPGTVSEDAAPCADLFEAISLAFHSQPLPLAVEKQVTRNPEPPKAPPAPLDTYLADLRDDFAISCPLKQKGDESLTAFANRRWEYAQAMIDARPV